MNQENPQLPINPTITVSKELVWLTIYQTCVARGESSEISRSYAEMAVIYYNKLFSLDQ